MSNVYKSVVQHPRQRCYFCGSEGPIETHHIAPRRHGGENSDDNLVDLCPTCHQRLERLYDTDFYKTIGLTDVETDGETSNEEREKIKEVKSVIAEIEGQYEEGAHTNIILEKIREKLDWVDDPKDELKNLRRRGEIYEPTQGRIRTV